MLIATRRGDGALEVTWADAGAATLLGVTHERLLGAVLLDALPLMRDALEVAARAGRCERALTIPWRASAPPLSLSVSAASGTGPAPAALVARLTAQARGAMSAWLLEQLFAQASQAMLVCRARDGALLLCNDAARALLGLGPLRPGAALETLLDSWRLLDTEGTPIAREARPIMRALRGEGVGPVELRVQRADGIEAWLSVRCEPVWGRDGALAAVAWSGIDISRHRFVEALLRRERDLLSAIMNTSATAITIIDAGGQFVFANPRAERVLGLSRGEIYQRAYNAPQWRITGVDGEPLADEALPFAQVLTSRQPVFDIQHAIAWPDGRRRLLSFNAAPFIEEGSITSVICSIEDITERHLAAEARRRLDARMQEADRVESLAVLAGGIAHDFNNLLVGVLGAAELALADLGERDPARAPVELIVDSARRAAELTQQMLAYSGRGRFVVERVTLATLVDEVRPLCEAAARTRARLRFELDPSPAAAVRVDRAQVRQVLVNLVLNALDAVPHGGAVVLRSGVMHADAAYLEACHGDALTPGVYAYVEICDAGCGMDHETRARIFDPFFTTKPHGHGLGLAATLGIMRGHGGFVRVDSAPAAGSTFRVGFPRDGAPPEAPA